LKPYNSSLVFSSSCSSLAYTLECKTYCNYYPLSPLTPFPILDCSIGPYPNSKSSLLIWMTLIWMTLIWMTLIWMTLIWMIPIYHSPIYYSPIYYSPIYYSVIRESLWLWSIGQYSLSFTADKTPLRLNSNWDDY